MQKSKALTFFLSFLPGLGHYYLGQMNRGLQIMIMFFGSIFLSSFIGLDLATPYIATIIWFYSLFDSLQQHRNIQEKQEVIDPTLFSWEKIKFKRNWIGWILIFLGVYMFLERIGYQFLDGNYFLIQTLKTIIIAVIFIGFGIYLLTGKKLLITKSEKRETK